MNLSDKDLDRLSREAANQHDPGDLVGSRSWERLELRLDKELGKLRPSPLQGIRSIRRIPFYYAPAILFLVGVSYYLVKHGKGNTAKTEPSGSPPLTAVKPLSPAPNNPDSSTKTLKNSPNSTRPDNELTVQYPTTIPATGTTPGTGTTPATGATPNAGTIPGRGAAASSNKGITPNAGAIPSAGTNPPAGTGTASGSTTPANTGVTPAPGTDNRTAASSAPRTGSHPSVTPHTNTLTESATTASHTSRNHRVKDRSGHHAATGQIPDQRYAATGQSLNQEYTANNPSNSSGSDPKKGIVPDRNNQAAVTAPREADISLIQAPHSLAQSGRIDDSALRAFAAKGAPVATPIRLGKKKDASLHINRPLSIGFSLSPDFASVHSMTGDRPGSSIGLTMDYEILNRLHIGTGLFLTRKNYAASPENYHVPKDYYQINSPSAHDINLVKGSFNMLEIPLNLRYDFSVSGNTVFFISGGASSYLLTSEHSQYYFNYFGRQACLNFNPTLEAGSKNYLFASVDLSAGVETGISNSLSLLIAPYVKLPTRGMGFGQIQLTSVGINFALKFSPVLGRNRK
ncbi:MAG TPA: hypothetical protein VNS58_12200 [Puia sp.]|nr:hypothetical protein [Puia sp.]